MIRRLVNNLVEATPSQVRAMVPAFLTLLGFVFGIFGGQIIQNMRPNWFSLANRANLVFVVMSITSIAVVIVVFYLWQKSIMYARSLYMVAIGATDEAELRSYTKAYRWLTKRVRETDREILLFTYYTYDTDMKREDYEPERMQGPDRNKLFKELERVITRNKHEYVRVFQKPDGYDDESFKTMLEEDQRYKDECQLIVRKYREMGTNAKMKLIFAPQVTRMSFVLIDRKYLFLNQDIYDPVNNRFLEPFIFIAEDKSQSTQFDSLWRLVERVRDHGVVKEWRDVAE